MSMSAKEVELKRRLFVEDLQRAEGRQRKWTRWQPLSYMLYYGVMALSFTVQWVGDDRLHHWGLRDRILLFLSIGLWGGVLFTLFIWLTARKRSTARRQAASVNEPEPPAV